MNEQSESQADMVFEASWEVTNKCGGIYTVVTSKLPLMQANYDTYCAIGPLFDKVPNDFIQQVPPETFARAFSHLALEGIRCIYGTWAVQGKPNTILIDARSLLKYVNNIKGWLWEKYGVDSINAAYDFDEPLAWSWGVGKFLENIANQLPENDIIAHLHEWLSGFALLYLKDKNARIATVFTTHATMLGRTLSSNNVKLFESLNNINPEEEAKRYGVMDKFSTERACALNADCFTTVSDTTAKECEVFFGKKPKVLPNGLAIDSYPTFEETIFRHLKNKERLSDFVMSQFFPYQTFDLTNTLYFYFGGRYEYRNKGFDIMIMSLAKLNEYLKSIGSKRTIVMFFFVATHSNGPKTELLENKSYVDGLTETVHERADYLLQRIVLNVLQGDVLNVDILPEGFMEDLKRSYHFVKRSGNPPICTHKIDENNDPTIQQLLRLGLDNREDNRVKVVFMPTYLDGGDSLLNMEYYEAVSACHLGIFPSYYEPWGYTPLESIALGVPAITTNTAGFGKYIQEEVIGTHSGLFIIDRTKKQESVIEELYYVMKEFSELDRTARVSRKMNAHALSSYADWRQLIRHYLNAHNQALKEMKKRTAFSSSQRINEKQ